MKKLSFLLAAIMVFCFMAPAFAAPVFPDVPEEHWARDAVASLAANGIVEGYPDGTFKGDRAATRYELAMVVARLLAKMEQEHANFATKADLDELRKLVDQLRAELDALGVRVTNLEDAVGKLDKRVTELERITFYGELNSIFVTQGFTICDMPLMFNGTQWVPEPTGFHYDTVGTSISGNYNPQLHSLMPSIDYRTGRPLTNGSGLTVAAKLGVTAKISEDVDAGLEFAGFTAIGDPLVNNFYGVSAPYYSNNFTGIFGRGFSLGGNNAGNSPWTRVTLDNFWVKHKPSGIKLVVGAFGDTMMDSILFAGQPNPNVNGSTFLNNAGVKISGKGHAISDLDWEVFYTTLPDVNIETEQVPYFPAGGVYSYDQINEFIYNTYTQLEGAQEGFRDPSYNTHAFGVNLNWHFRGGNFRVGYLRALNDTLYGQGDGANMYGPYGISPGYLGTTAALLNWVNPYGVSGRVINGNLGFIDVFGQQETTNWSARFNYTWEDSKIKPRFFAEYAASTYKPTREVDFDVTGNALRAGLGVTLANDSFDIDVEYKSVDADYDPFVLRYPVSINAMWRLPQFSYYPNMYQLHDSEVYTNNREGWTFKLTYRFKDEKGKIWASYDLLEQKQSSAYNEVYAVYDSANAFNYRVLGYTPGFIDAFFRPYNDNSYHIETGAALDDHIGKANKFAIGVDYKFDSNWAVDANYYHQSFKRDTSLVIGQTYDAYGIANFANTGISASTNYVDLKLNGFHIGVSYPFNEKFSAKAAYDYTSIKGHYDPNNVYGAYAAVTIDYAFQNIDVKQSVPSIGFDYRLSKNTEWGLDFKYFDTKDNVRILNPSPVIGEVAPNPFSWKGTQVSTEFKVKF